MPSKVTRLGDAVWGAMRDEYVTGNESYSALAKRYGVNLKTVEKHALNRDHPTNEGLTWGERRVEFRKRTSEETETKVTAVASRTLAIVREKSVNVAMLALEELERRLTPPTNVNGEPAPILLETSELIQAAKLATTVKVELSGDPDAPALIQAKLDELSIEQLRKLAEGT